MRMDQFYIHWQQQNYHGKKTKINEKVVPFIKEYFEVSKLQASEYYNLMTTDELKLLLKQYGKTDKEIKKMGVK